MDGPAPEESDRFRPGLRPKPPRLNRKPPSVIEGPRHRGLCDAYHYGDRYFFYINRTERCAHLCDRDILFTQENKRFAEIWTSLWACFCFASTLFTLGTFFVDSRRFHYPERGIIYLSGCYNVYSVAYFVRLLLGRSSVSCHLDSQHEVPILIQEGVDNINCTAVFMLLYYFGMASATWWVVLTVTWFLAAGLRWSHERVQKHMTAFHFFAWVLPAVQTIVILVMRVVDADELTGTCFVGNQNSHALLGFVVLPSSAYLLVGACFLLWGFVAMVRSRDSLSHAPKADKLELIMIRVGIFAVLYIIPAACVLASYVYEYSFREVWLAAGSALRPNVEVFTLRIFMSLVVGITTGLWTWSSRVPLAACRRPAVPAYVDHKSPHGLVFTAHHYQQQPMLKRTATVEKPKRVFRGKGGSETTV